MLVQLYWGNVQTNRCAIITKHERSYEPKLVLEHYEELKILEKRRISSPLADTMVLILVVRRPSLLKDLQHRVHCNIFICLQK